jgi:hypothetical protein
MRIGIVGRGAVYASIGLLIGLAISAASIHSQEKPKDPPKFEATEVQHLKLEVKQRDALLAQRDLTMAQRVYNESVAALGAECESVRKENNWPQGVSCDLQTLNFAAPKAEEKKPEEKPPAKK